MKYAKEDIEREASWLANLNTGIEGADMIRNLFAENQELQSRLESLEKDAARYRQIPYVTQSMIDAAESVEDLYKRGTPETWGKVFRVMYADMLMYSAE